NGDTEEPRLAHLGKDIRIRGFLRVGPHDPRLQLILREGARPIAPHTLIICQLRLEEKGIFPAEGHEVWFAVPALRHGALTQSVQLRSVDAATARWDHTSVSPWPSPSVLLNPCCLPAEGLYRALARNFSFFQHVHAVDEFLQLRGVLFDQHD